MFNWLSRRRKEKKARIEQQVREFTQALEESLAKHKAEMLSRPCAINGMRNCEERCVHFKEGNIAVAPLYRIGEIYQFQIEPKCKLWKD